MKLTVEQWDYVGWLMIAAFFAFCAAAEPLFLTFCLLLGFPVFLLWSVVDRTK